MKNPAAVALGRLGGSVRSARKNASSSKNGKLGGRPRIYGYAVADRLPDDTVVFIDEALNRHHIAKGEAHCFVPKVRRDQCPEWAEWFPRLKDAVQRD